jgi:hypothetical protein
MREWISVTEHLPARGERVLIVTHEVAMRGRCPQCGYDHTREIRDIIIGEIGNGVDGCGVMWRDGYASLPLYHVTHWMPLPALPAR